MAVSQPADERIAQRFPLPYQGAVCRPDLGVHVHALYSAEQIAWLIATEVAQEREACAILCEQVPGRLTGADYGKLIRSREQRHGF